MRNLKQIIGGLLVAALAACGGGGGDSGSSSGGGSTAPTVASFNYQLDKNALTNSGSDEVLLTITALTAGNNPVSGVTATVSVDTGIYTPNATTTNDSGQVSGRITIGGNKANRSITATVRVGSFTANVVVPVTGAQITLTPVPATPGPGASVTLAVKVTDVNNNGISGAAIQLSGTLGYTQLLTTDSGGNASALLGAAPVTVGTYNVAATGMGVSALRDVQVVGGGGGGGIPDAVGPISAASLAIVPNNIAPNLTGATTNRAGLRATFLNASNAAIQNVRVRFEIVAPGLGSGEQISTGAATVYTDVSGNAIADYIAGTRSSPTNGVIIRACYGLNDAAIAGGLCPDMKTATMTVASQPLSITLGDNNELAKGNSNLTYKKLFDVAVADSVGAAVPNALISASVDITHYGKGNFFWGAPTFGTPSYAVTGNVAPNISTAPFSTSTTPSSAVGRVWCPNEDVNRNGAIDTGEDIDSDNKLSPRKADVIVSFVGGNTTSASGRATIQVEYPQNVATWLSYTVKVTTNVAGSEGTVEKSYITNFVAGDEVNGSFLDAPYGVNNCQTRD